MHHPNFYQNDPRVEYYGSVEGFDFYMTDEMDIIIQHGSEVHQCMCMPLRHARNFEATHYKAAVAIWDLSQVTKELA